MLEAAIPANATTLWLLFNANNSLIVRTLSLVHLSFLDTSALRLLDHPLRQRRKSLRRMRRELTYAEAAVLLQANPGAAQQEWLSRGMFSCPALRSQLCSVSFNLPCDLLDISLPHSYSTLIMSMAERAQVLRQELTPVWCPSFVIFLQDFRTAVQGLPTEGLQDQARDQRRLSRTSAHAERNAVLPVQKMPVAPASRVGTVAHHLFHLPACPRTSKNRGEMPMPSWSPLPRRAFCLLGVDKPV